MTAIWPGGCSLLGDARAARVDGSWRLAGVVTDSPEGPACRSGPIELVVRAGVVERLRRADQVAGGRNAPPLPDAPRLVLMPLLVNAHDHGRGRGNVLAGIRDAPLEPWIAALRAHSGGSQERLVGDAGAAMLAAGVGASVVCVNPQRRDVDAEVVAAARAARQLGLRAAIVYPFADAMGSLSGRARTEPGDAPRTTAQRLDRFERIAAAVEGPDIELQLGPVGPQWVSEATLAALGAHARRHGRRVHMHLLESRAQRTWADTTYPDGLVPLLERSGLLGPHVCVAHGTQLRAGELAGLAESGAVLALNASSNLRLASGIPPVADALASAVALGAGLDGLALGDDADYWNELRLLRGIAQAQAGAVLDAGALLGRVLRGGRRALGRCAPRDPAEGGLADFVLVDLGEHAGLFERGWMPAEVALAVASPGKVSEVWVAGRAVYRRRASEPPAPAAKRSWKTAGATGGR